MESPAAGISYASGIRWCIFKTDTIYFCSNTLESSRHSKKKKNTENSNTIIVEIQVSETSYLMTRYDTHGMLYYDTRGYMYITQ